MKGYVEGLKTLHQEREKLAGVWKNQLACNLVTGEDKPKRFLV